MVGLAVTYSLSVTDSLRSVITTFASTETEMISMERANQYIQKIPHESKDEDAIINTKPGWPRNANIIFNNVTLTYKLVFYFCTSSVPVKRFSVTVYYNVVGSSL